MIHNIIIMFPCFKVIVCKTIFLTVNAAVVSAAKATLAVASPNVGSAFPNVATPVPPIVKSP